MKEAIELWNSHILKDGEILSKPSIDAYFRPKDPNEAYFRVVEGEYQQARTAGLHHAIVEVGNNLSDLLDLLPGFSYDCNKSRIKKLEAMLSYLKSQL